MGGYLLSVFRFEAAIIELISILCKRQSEESASLTGRIFIPSQINEMHDYRLTLYLFQKVKKRRTQMVGQGHRSFGDNQIIKMTVTVQPCEGGLLQPIKPTVE
jgi:hypothetical protein